MLSQVCRGKGKETGLLTGHKEATAWRGWLLSQPIVVPVQLCLQQGGYRLCSVRQDCTAWLLPGETVSGPHTALGTAQFIASMVCFLPVPLSGCDVFQLSAMHVSEALPGDTPSCRPFKDSDTGVW